MNKIIVALLSLILMFGYFSFFGIRLLPLIFLLLIIIILTSIIFNSFIIEKDISLIIASVLTSIVFVFSIYTGSFDFFAGLLVFFTLSHWPLFVNIKNPHSLSNSVSAMYIYSGIVLSLGLFIQIFMFKFLGLSFGKIDLYGGKRLAFAFTWQDYSFLSLYFASCIPLVLSHNFKIKFFLKLVLIAFLIVASLSTTARTGLASLILTMVLYSALNIDKVIVNKKLYYACLITILAYPLFVFLKKDFILIEREITVSSSGRTEGYAEGISYFTDNILLGSIFDPIRYRDTIGVIPHNLFIYLAVVGGLCLVVFTIFWLLTIMLKVYRLDSKELVYSFIICLIGFQFIPSIFSGYFFSILISIIFINYKYRVNP
ncbi:hypothetical protein [Psychrobacter sp. Pi2-51]|uniref:hypothetical protein n=1 Tax=Psychrobacter sp. Pi2-51 TaxID=2774132 RepID=UPI00191A9129|nr:hypothetical protein [Psychrobacter sp. Pi2-51]